MSKCICKGNLRLIIEESREILGKKYCDDEGEVWYLFGIVYGEDDLYYGMVRIRDNKLKLLTCVGSIENQGMVVVDESVGNYINRGGCWYC